MPSRLSGGLRCFALAVVLLLSACALVAPRQLPELPLLAPADFFLADNTADVSAATRKTLQFSEQVRIRRQGEEQVMLAAWAVSAEELTMVGLTPTGQRLMTLRYDGENFSEDYSALMREPIPGRQVLSHMQMAHWPAASIEEALKQTPWRVEFREGQRRFFLRRSLSEDVLVMEIDTSAADQVRITSPVMDYELEVRKL